MHIRTVFAAVLLAGAATPGLAAPACSVDALNALHVPNVGDRGQAGGGERNRAGLLRRARHGRHQGRNAPDGSARFALQLPEAWRQRFLFLGVGGNAGNLVPSANAMDRASALGKGYATILTDTGHVGDGTNASWTRLPDGKPDTAKRIDFFHRAAHDVTVAGKAFAEAYYAAPVAACLFRRLLDRRAHGDDGGRALSRRTSKG